MKSDTDNIVPIPVYGIPTIYVNQVWSQVEPILKDVIEESDDTVESTRQAVLDGTYHLWIIGDYSAVAVTQIIERPKRRIAWIQFIAGKDMNIWFDAWIEALEHYAQNEDCAAIEFAGRKGWLRHAKKHPEYKPTKTLFRREF